jgi:hypothetical protein
VQCLTTLFLPPTPTAHSCLPLLPPRAQVDAGARKIDEAKRAKEHEKLNQASSHPDPIPLCHALTLTLSCIPRPGPASLTLTLVAHPYTHALNLVVHPDAHPTPILTLVPAQRRIARACERFASAQVSADARKAVRAEGGASPGTSPPSDGILVSDGHLTIGDVSVALRVGGSPSLVPNPSFVPIAGHVRLLHELLVDWSLGQHLLLLGEQGVGKNSAIAHARIATAIATAVRSRTHRHSHRHGHRHGHVPHRDDDGEADACVAVRGRAQSSLTSCSLFCVPNASACSSTGHNIT